ncbi:MAG: hypothetical protein OCD02_02300 [Spirochaetaceae bacterium]
MRKFLVIFLLSILSTLYSQEEDRKIVFSDTIYDPFFSVLVKDNEGEQFSVSRFAFFDEYNEKKFFFWVRRNSGLYALSFKNIKRITFDSEDFADNRYEGFTRCTLDLVTGVSQVVYLKTTGHMEGWDEVFGSPVTFYMHYNLIESIEFNHEGEYYYCPFCETIYFDDQLDKCIYDQTPLIQGVISVSDK